MNHTLTWYNSASPVTNGLLFPLAGYATTQPIVWVYRHENEDIKHQKSSIYISFHTVFVQSFSLLPNIFQISRFNLLLPKN